MKSGGAGGRVEGHGEGGRSSTGWKLPVEPLGWTRAPGENVIVPSDARRHSFSGGFPEAPDPVGANVDLDNGEGCRCVGSMGASGAAGTAVAPMQKSVQEGEGTRQPWHSKGPAMERCWGYGW